MFDLSVDKDMVRLFCNSPLIVLNDNSDDDCDVVVLQVEPECAGVRFPGDEKSDVAVEFRSDNEYIHFII